MKTKIKWKDWISPAIMLIACIIVFIIYVSTKGFDANIVYHMLTYFATLVIPIFNLYCKKFQIPLFINLLITINLILAMLLGSALRVYDSIVLWDKVCHTYFGLEVAFIFTYFAQLLKLDKMPLFAYIILMLTFVLGLACIWEFCEYFMDSNFGTDFQNIQRSMNDGYLPQWDTMWDLLVAAIGDFIYLILYLVDRFALKFKIHNTLGFNLTLTDTEIQ